MKLVDRLGHRYSMLLVVARGPNLPNSAATWTCMCDCGRTVTVPAQRLQMRENTSCGCAKIERARQQGYRNLGRRKPDARSRSRLYRTWKGMWSRCRNPNDGAFHNYGARGIAICAEWDDFAAFRAWALESGYTDTLTIDRINNDGGYSPDNCRWISRGDQCANRRTVPTAEDDTPWFKIAEKNGISRTAYRMRVHRGMPHSEAATRPVLERYRSH